MPLSVIFMGTPDFAVSTLTEIVGAGHEVVAVYTQPPRPAGRGMAERPGPVAEAAKRFGFEVRSPLTFKEDGIIEEFQRLEADVAVVVAYGLILPQSVLEGPKLGCVNLHASLLPRWRGAAPIQRAIMAGDRETGVAVMQMEAGLDTGPVGMVEQVAITPDMTAGMLHDVLARIGADLMHRALGAMEREALSFAPQQEGGVTYANKIDKAECKIDWSRPAQAVHDHIRGLSPFPGSWFEAEIGGKVQRVKALRSSLAEGKGDPGTILDDALTIACGDGAVRLIEVQRSGKRPMPTADFLLGQSLSPGMTLV